MDRPPVAGRSATAVVDTPPPPATPASPDERWPELSLVNERPGWSEYLRRMWRHRHFAMTVPAGELRAQHQDTLLGQLWHLCNPLLLTGVYWLIFGTLLSRGAIDGVPYFSFLVVGIIPFGYTQKAISSGSRLIHGNRNLIQSVPFPRALLPSSAVLGELLAHLPAIGVMLAVVGTTWLLAGPATLLSPTWLLVVPIVLLQTMFNLGLSLVSARLTFHFRDVQQIIPYLMRILFYLSGVIIPLDTLAASRPTARLVLGLNPIAAVVELTRDAVLHGTTAPRDWSVLGGWTVVLLLGGFVFFRAAEKEYGSV